MIEYRNKIPTVDEFNYLNEKVGWGKRSNKVVKEALKNTLSAICAGSGVKSKSDHRWYNSQFVRTD